MYIAYSPRIYIHSTELEGGDYNRIGAILLDLELIDGVKSIGYLIRDSFFFVGVDYPVVFCVVVAFI